ncbi:MAG TPA: glycosyltransferase family 39 protein, partial [Longimicrobium sp.]|nr:glycosyltransferase family 39 protein [Longimicrobium sp.]
MRRLLLVLLLAAGAALRLLQYGVNRALWLDEALLTLNVLGRTPAQLLTRPLDYGQTAPAGFLLLQKLAVTLLGTGEYALRLVPLAAGLAALFWFPRVARRYVSRAALPLAVALFALAPFLVYYSSEAKQYALDVLAAVALLACAAAVRHRPSRRALAAFAAAGVAAVWVSQPAVFVLAGTGAVLAAAALRRRDARTFRSLAMVAGAWMASFAGSYALSRNALADAGYMRAFWRAGFPSAADPLWLPRMALRLFREPLGVFGEDPTPMSLVATWAGAVAFTAGCAWMARNGRGPRLALLLAPAGMALAAAALRLYPFGADYTSAGRVLLFLLPALAMVVAEGTVRIGRWIGGTAGRAAAAGLGLAILAPSLVYAAVQVPHARAEVKPLLAYAAQERQPGDVLYVHYGGRAPFLYYAPRYGWTPRNAVVGACSRLDPAGYLRGLEPLRGRRVWLLFIDDRAITRSDDRGLMLGYLEHQGRRVDDQVSIGAALYLYDLRQPPARPGPFRARLPRYAPDPALECRGP